MSKLIKFPFSPFSHLPEGVPDLEASVHDPRESTEPPPPRVWVWDGLVPAGEATLFAGDGGTGKSLLALQAGMHISLGIPLFGRAVRRMPVFVLALEDDRDEVFRRMWAIAKHLGITVPSLRHFGVMCRDDYDPTLFAPDSEGRLAETPTATFIDYALDYFFRSVGPLPGYETEGKGEGGLIIIDNASLAFAGNENAKIDVVAFVNRYIQPLARRHNATVLVLGHVSRASLASGAGVSGNTHWSNGFRSRLYLEKPRGDDGGGAVDKAARTLSLAKANYAEDGAIFALRLVDGAFLQDDAQASAGATDGDAAAARLLAFIAKRWESNRPLSPSPTSAVYAPRVAMRELGLRRSQMRELERALSSLIEDGRVAIESIGPKSKAKDILRPPVKP
jgi:RecA-family ATPase